MCPARGDTAPRGESRRARTIRELRELVAALDRRAPQVERVGEVAIARAAEALRAAAVQRIQELERTGAEASGSPAAEA